MQRSELLGFKWDSINWANNSITVKEKVVKIKTTIRKQGTKTKSSFRTLKLPLEIINALKDEKKQQEQYEKLFGKDYCGNDYILKRQDGKPYVPNTFTNKIQSIMGKAGLPQIRLHDIRHTTGSLLLNMGKSIKEIQCWLGHSDYRTTANIYLHLFAQVQGETAEEFAYALNL